MFYYRAKTPSDYQTFFYEYIGLIKTTSDTGLDIWQNPEIGYIRSFGDMNTIQAGIGDYHIPKDLLVEYCYDSVYLHFGTIYEGITYSVVDEKTIPTSIPSSFISIEKASHGINRWNSGQSFRGIELSVYYPYLQKVILPFLGCDENALSFLTVNARYINLTDEMKAILAKIESLLIDSRITRELLISLTISLIALVLHKENRHLFVEIENNVVKQLKIGNRSIRITSADNAKINQAKELIDTNAEKFPNAYALSHKLHISEQKLKAGFFEMYQQTLWDYANTVRMNMAAKLLRESSLSVLEISKQIGYQSQSAFCKSFKHWSGMTPLSFRIRASEFHLHPHDRSDNGL